MKTFARTVLQAIIVPVIFMMTFTCAVTEIYAGDKPEQQLPPELENILKQMEKRSERPDMSLLWEVYDLIRKHGFNSGISDEELFDGAIRGMVKAVDQYSHYENPEDVKLDEPKTNGKYFGIGALLQNENTSVKVLKVYPKSPAEKAGLKSGDRITEIDGEKIRGMKRNEPFLKIRGGKGMPIKLKIWREGWKEEREITIIRGEIKTEDVTSKMIEKVGKRLAYIKIEGFTEGAVDGFRKAIIKARNDWKADGVIIDLRDNPGGFVSSVLQMASAWINTDQAVYLEKDRLGRTASANAIMTKSVSSTLLKTPTVVLINGYSASASEILAGALQDYGKATIVGTQSYGKGTVQSLVPLSNKGYLAITIRHWFTPKDRPIDEIGVQPDVEVSAEPDEKDICSGKNKKDPDPQLEKAIEILTK